MHSFFTSNTNINGRDDSLYFLMTHFPTIAGDSEVFDRSVMSLASNDKSLEYKGLEIYNSAVNAMSRDLRRKSKSGTEMLYSNVILHTREVSLSEIPLIYVDY
ncbi:uncharacterized protein N7483_007563 [Penicillium malachiteum]|uniref:uncharacterized protein n=1 Tax=Penicillium malachiteum TaxID=1324776 RepID=UPI0025492EDB|nr:uncharacterized protein N7483_007563 [Penicillium malachiteum]KAJ5726206.1 hypothetical protein N7483_007563 [Penicillium malachiteum]